MPCMSNVYDPMLATAMTKTTTVVIASIKGVAATRTPARNTTRDAGAVPAVSLRGGVWDRNRAARGIHLVSARTHFGDRSGRVGRRGTRRRSGAGTEWVHVHRARWS